MRIYQAAAALLALTIQVVAQSERGGATRPGALPRPEAAVRKSARPLVPSKAAQGEDVDRIFERFIEAQGGLAAMAKIRTRVMRGYAEHSKSNLPGSIEYYAKAPNKTLSVIQVPGGAQFIESFDGRDSWSQSPFNGALAVSQTSAVILDRGAEFGRMPKATAMYSAVSYKGKARVGGSEANVVEAVRAGGHPQLLYFDTSSGLLLRADVLLVAPDGESVPVKFFYDKYAKVDGVTLPVTVRQVFPDWTITFRIYEVKHNVNISDALFETPGAAK